MFKNLRGKIALSGMSVLIIGIVLLILTFIISYGFLTADLSITSSQDLNEVVGNALGPLIVAGIHAMYMGIMVWVGSILTVRGVTMITHNPQHLAVTLPNPVTIESKPQIQSQPQLKSKDQPLTHQEEQKLKVDKPKKETSKDEEIAVIPPEEVEQAQHPRNLPK